MHVRQGAGNDGRAFPFFLRMLNVEPIKETYRRNCIIANIETGKKAAKERSNVVNLLSV
jgi:hypothetical protein